MWSKRKNPLPSSAWVNAQTTEPHGSEQEKYLFILMNVYMNPPKYSAEFCLLIGMWDSTDDYSLTFLVLLLWATWYNCTSPPSLKLSITPYWFWPVSGKVTVRNH